MIYDLSKGGIKGLIFKICLGIILVGIGAIIVYLARFFLNIFWPNFANEKGILATKLIGLLIFLLGAFIIFITGVNEYK